MDNDKSKITAALLGPDEEDILLGFMKAYLDNWEKFQKYWGWRQSDRPSSCGESAVIAKEGGNIIGSVGIVPARLNFRNADVKVSWQQDSLVAPAGRGKGIGKRLVNKGGEGWDLVMAKGTSETMYGLRKKLGFIDVPNSDYLLKITKPRLMIRRLKPALMELGLFLYDIILPMPRRDKNIEVKEVESFDKGFNSLAEQLSSVKGLRLIKDQGYLNWRYAKCPDRIYRIFRAGGEKARGAVVLNITGKNFEEGWIVDLICDPEDKGCAFALLREGVRYLKKNGVSRIWAFATLPSSRKWFYRFGFVSTGRTPRFTFRVQGGIIDSKELIKTEWDFWHGDGDVELYM
jgi:GNAT superfamily N-acetyltransferase